MSHYATAAHAASHPGQSGVTPDGRATTEALLAVADAIHEKGPPIFVLPPAGGWNEDAAEELRRVLDEVRT